MDIAEFFKTLLVFLVVLPAILAIMLFATQSFDVARGVMTVYYIAAFVGILGMASKR